MPTRTPHFGFQAFVSGDYYSGAIDKQRFTDIDQHMEFISSAIGPGRVSGWVISQPNIGILSIDITPGMGLIDNNIIRTFGNKDKTLLDNNLVYIWMKRRPGVIGQAGAFSGIATYDHLDVSAPLTPTTFAVSQSTVSSILLSWDENTLNYDFKEFKIYKSENNVDFELLTSTSDTSYLDSNLDDNTNYYYRISSIDFSGNESSQTSTLVALTDLDVTPPTDPVNVSVTPATNAIHMLWRPAAFGDIEFYRIYITPVNLENQSIGSTISIDVDGNTVHTSIQDLDNNQKYKLRLVSVGDNAIESSGVTLFSTPDFFSGPRDVVDLELSDSEGDGFVSDTVLVVDWEPFIDPYDTNPPVSHEIQIEEIDTDNSSIITSIWINEPVESLREFKIYSYIDSDGRTRNRSIRSRTTYFVTIRAIDVDGNSSVGRTARHYTRTYESPRSITRLSVEQRDDQTIEFTWFNSTSIFKNNVINLEREDVSNPSLSISLEEDTEVGFSSSYIINQEDIVSDSSYVFSIKARDEFGNESSERDVVFDIPNISDLTRPSAPNQILGVSNDSENTISWNQPDSEIAVSYRIYRADQQISYISSDFARIETVDSLTFNYTDYDVNNLTTYAYFVTTIDLYGIESLNPVDDDFFDYNLILLTPTTSGELGTPANLSIQIDGATTGIDLLWDPTAGQFDGYEIFKSIGNTYEFELVDTTPPSQTSYNDPESLLESDTYYYIVRKFKNEADLFVTESDIVVNNAQFLGTVETTNGVIEIDQSGVREIKDLEDPIKEKAQELISAHKHEFFTRIDDRRINLGDVIRVDDWVTQNFQNYTTTADLENTFSFEVFLNDQLASDFDLLFNIDRELGRITFEKKLAPTDFSTNDNNDFPFDSPPELVVVFEGLTETQGILPQERLESASANQVTIGLVEKRQLPDIGHEGRIKELLIPIQEPMLAVDDGYRFTPVNEGQIIGDAITWYDIILANTTEDGDVLVGSSSNGIYTSQDFGATWIRRRSFSTPVIEFYYSSSIDMFFALTNRGVFGKRGKENAGSFGTWREIQGMENAKITRGISETPDGDIFCTSDIGVFKLIQDIGRDFYFWEQTPIFGPRSTESYDTIYDHVRDRVLVSNELGIFESDNGGVLWSFSDEMPDQRPIFQFKMYGDTIFAITQFILWRRKPGETEFQRVSILRDVDITRKIEIWRDRVFITTDKGLLVSLPNSDIDNDSEIDFELAFPQMNSGSFIPPASSMNIIDDKMFIGTEEQLFLSVNPGSMSLQWEDTGNTVPTVYIDGVEQKIGVRYNTATQDLRKFVCFDEKQKIGSVVTIANQYKRYKAENGGWADSNYESGVQLFVNGFFVNDWSVTERPATAIGNLILPEYNDRNAHKAGADTALTGLQSIASTLLDLGDDADNPILLNFNKANVVIFLNSLDRFLSQVYPEARTITNEDNTVSPFEVPAFRVLLLSSNEDFKSYGVEEFGTYGDNTSIEEDLDGPVSEEDIGGGIGG